MDYIAGTWAWGTGANGGKIVFGKKYTREQLSETFEKAYAQGITMWDTAEVYGNGSSEMLLGGLIKDKKDIKISTKHFPNKKYKQGETSTSLEKSLNRLGIEKAEYYWLHSPKNIKENMLEMAECAKNGKIENIGLSNCSVQQIKEADEVLRAKGTKLKAIQNHYSLLTIEREKEVYEYCMNNGIEFWGYMILEQGILSGKYDENHTFPKLSMRGLSFNKNKFRKIKPLLQYQKQLAEKYGIDTAQIPIIWAKMKGIKPIIGLTKPTHAKSLIEASTVKLTKDEVIELEKLALNSEVTCKGMWE
ncbi:MAG: aldo/keto reductase [Ruminococcus sp.]|nr:aldo/keto reductase [Ruminococcus sp.]